MPCSFRCFSNMASDILEDPYFAVCKLKHTLSIRWYGIFSDCWHSVAMCQQLLCNAKEAKLSAVVKSIFGSSGWLSNQTEWRRLTLITRICASKIVQCMLEKFAASSHQIKCECLLQRVLLIMLESILPRSPSSGPHYSRNT